MNYKDVNKKFTEIVEDFISKGYTINSGTMDNSDQRKVDFTDGKDVYRVYMEYNTESYADNYNVLNTVNVCVGKINYNVKANVDPMSSYFDSREIKEIYKYPFYCAGRSKRGRNYFIPKDEAEIAEGKRIEREERNSGNISKYGLDYYSIVDVTSPETIDLATKMLKKSYGYKRINTKEIEIEKLGPTKKPHTKIKSYGTHEIRYVINYHNKTIKLYNDGAIDW